MRCASALSTARNSVAAIDEVLDRVTADLAGEPADLAVAFVTAHHAQDLSLLSTQVRGRKLARHLIGCTGEAIVGGGHEIEDGPAISLWVLRAPGVELTPIRLSDAQMGLDELGASAHDVHTKNHIMIFMGDPFSFPIDAWLKGVNTVAPGLRIGGGMASASQRPGGNRLVLDGLVYEDGAVAMRIAGPLAIRTIVSQGCRPIGRPMIVTKIDRNLVCELGRRPALEVFREILEGLDPEERELVRNGLHIGRVINEYQDTFGRGDFLVRNVLGADESGAIAITDVLRVGQTVQFHVRDAATADEDLRSLLEQGRQEGAASGALLFTCNGRGSRLFVGPDHDIGAIREHFGPIPTAGFFAMGEIGPIGDQNFLHGFTASLVIFAP